MSKFVLCPKKGIQNQLPVKKSGINAILIRLFEKHPGVELTHQQICTMVEARDPMSRQVVFEGLNALASKNAIKRINHFTYSLSGNSNLVEGVIQLTQRGAGFVVVEGKEKDVFIAPQNIGQALNGDTVKCVYLNQDQIEMKALLLK